MVSPEGKGGIVFPNHSLKVLVNERHIFAGCKAFCNCVSILGGIFFFALKFFINCAGFVLRSKNTGTRPKIHVDLYSKASCK